MQTLWRLIAAMFACLIANCILLITLRLIPLDSWVVWLQVISAFVVVFITLSVTAILKTKWEDKRYNNLLSDYKKRQERENSDD